MDAEKIKDKLENYTYNLNRLAEVQEQINSLCPKITPTYGNLAPAFGGNNDSKVERQGNRDIELEQRRNGYLQKVLEVRHMIEHSNLNKTEKAILWWIAHNGRLAAYARRERIGKDNVYKIRDRAIEKIIAANTPQNVG